MERFDRPRQALAIGLAALAGFVDAVGFLSADGYFVSFMSGNTTRLGVDLAKDWRGAATPALLITGFVAGVAAGGLVALRMRQRRKPAVLTLVAVLLLLAAVLRSSGQVEASLAALVAAMGALNNTFQRDGEIAVGLTYMTGALIRLGQGLAAKLAGERRSDWPAYLLLWLGLASGATTGALVFVRIGAAALWLAFGYAVLFVWPAWRLSQPN
jgi:uncharacterized membrane protein YoaK (UPF0700 family)